MQARHQGRPACYHCWFVACLARCSGCHAERGQADGDEEEATNENIGLDVGAQRMTMQDIQALVDAGVDGRVGFGEFSDLTDHDLYRSYADHYRTTDCRAFSF